MRIHCRLHGRVIRIAPVPEQRDEVPVVPPQGRRGRAVPLDDRNGLRVILEASEP